MAGSGERICVIRRESNSHFGPGKSEFPATSARLGTASDITGFLAAALRWIAAVTFELARLRVFIEATRRAIRWERYHQGKQPIAGSTCSAALPCRFNYLISLLVTVAGSAPQFSRITSVWSEKNVRRPVFPNTS